MTERGNPMTLFRCLPLALVAFAFHAQAQSLSPAYDAFRKKETPAPAPAQPATPVQTDAAPPAPAPVAAPAPAPYAATFDTAAREQDDGGFFVGVQAGQGWIYEDVEQDAVAVSAGYRWQAGPWTQVGVELSGGRLEQPGELDVREIPHGQRHPRIFARYARLAPGESFVLVNNHDPKPLRREFQATHPGAFSWDYEQSGPDLWKVRIGRVATGD